MHRSNYSTENGIFEISDFYVGSAAYLTPLIDNSGNRRHLKLDTSTIQSGKVFSEVGRFGKGLQFNNARIKGEPGLANFTGDFSVSFWVKPHFPLLDSYEMLMGARTNNSGWQLQLQYAGVIGVNTSGGPGFGVSINTTSWNHVVFRYTASNGKRELIVNGVITVSPSNYFITYSMREPFMLCGANNMSNRNFGGEMDDIAFFDRILTDKEVYALYKTSLPKHYTSADWLLDKDNPQNAVTQYTPRYLGKTLSSPSTSNVVIQQTSSLSVTVAAHVGDYVLYGTNVLRWIGFQWEILNQSDGRNSGAYMEALADILADITTTGTFKAAFIKNIFASTIQAEVVNVLMKLMVGSGTDGILIDGQNKLIQSANYAAGSAGFKLDSNGNAEFNNGTFRGTLAAKNLNITGSVITGDNYLLKRNNIPISADYQYEGIMKSITVLARGSCKVKITIERLERDSPYGFYKLFVNGDLKAQNNVTATGTFILDISLNQSVNTIDIYGRGNYTSGGMVTVFSTFVIGKFELWTYDDPGMLAVF